MKRTKILFSTVAIAMFFLGSETCSAGFFKDLFNGVKKGIDTYINNTPPSSAQENTRRDAWKSGKGGKVLAAIDFAASAIGEATNNKDIKKLSGRIHTATEYVTQNDNFSKSEKANWIGAGFGLADQLVEHGQDVYFANKVKKYTDPSDPEYNEELAMMVESIDYENREIIWKDHSEYIRELMEARKAKNDQWVDESLQQVNGMTLEEYDNLSMKKRQEVDEQILAYDDSKSKSEPVAVEETPVVETPQKVDYKSLIEGVVVSDYDINSFKLSAEQEELLKKISELLAEDESLALIICGNTCSLGTEAVNYEVGLKRASEAKNYLVNLGIDAGRIEVTSDGYSNPVADNSTLEGRKSNRRLTFKLK